MNREVIIDRLGARGDGVAVIDGETVHVPFALPGERVLVAREGGKARLVDIREASSERTAPACRHYGQCGGCNLQHLADPAYRAWKAGRVAAELAARGIDVPVAELQPCAPHSRRRATFTVANVDGRLAIGYRAAASHQLVPVEECPIVVPEIVAALPVLLEIGRQAGAGRQPVRLLVTHGAAGLDVAMDGVRGLNEARRQALLRLALKHDLARLSAGDEILIQSRPPQIMVGDAVLTPPPGGFLQATRAAEKKMAALVAGHLRGCRNVADLYAGSGSFALRLARHASVHAVEGQAAALAALERAYRGTAGLKRITTERRDLERRPLTAAELQRHDGLVFDPPRAGAAAQAAQIARSGIAKVAAVSCNPATLAADLALLRDGGYRILSVTPIDQFLWSPHVEAVALAEKRG